MMSENTNDTQEFQIRETISKVVAVGPDFLAKKISAEKMAQTMVMAVENYIRQAQAEGTIHPKSSEARELQGVLQEIEGCGSGFLAQRCDAACVARTIRYILDEFQDKATV